MQASYVKHYSLIRDINYVRSKRLLMDQKIMNRLIATHGKVWKVI